MADNRFFSRTGYLGFVLGIAGQLYVPHTLADPQEHSFVKQASEIAGVDQSGGSNNVPVVLSSQGETLEFCVMNSEKQEFRPQESCRVLMSEFRIPALAYRGRIGVSQMQLVASSHVQLAKEKNVYGRQELVDVLNYAACVMQQVYGATLEVRDLSREGGGRLRPHKSHRDGRDADVGMYVHTDEQGLYSVSRAMLRRGKVDREFMAPQALDANVQFLNELVTGPYEVEWIFVDKKLIHALETYAVGKYGAKFWQPIEDVLKHEPGHRNHYHIRTKVPRAERVT